MEGISPQQSHSEKISEEFLRSNDLIDLYEKLDADTYDGKEAVEAKKFLVKEIRQNEIVSPRTLQENPLIYLGSGRDIALPLLLGGRDIRMVDPLYTDEKSMMDIYSFLQNQKLSPEIEGRNIRISFDFGEGKEQVVITFEPKRVGKIIAYDYQAPEYRFPEKIAAIISFRAGTVPFEIGKTIIDRLVSGGYIFTDTPIGAMADIISRADARKYPELDVYSRNSLVKQYYSRLELEYIPLANHKHPVLYTSARKL